MSMTLNINGTRREFDGDPDTPLLWVIRDELGLTGTKYGCGIAQCGACTVHVDGQTLRSCSAPQRRRQTGRAACAPPAVHAGGAGRDMTRSR